MNEKNNIRSTAYEQAPLRLKYTALTIILGALVLACVELKHPYFFLQDDNRTMFLPWFAYNLKSLAAGHIPFYNFHQYLGQPHFSNGISSVFYPLVYVAVWLSKLLWGNFYASIDLLVVMHLLIGGVGCYKLMTRLGYAPMIGLWAGIAWELNPFVVYTANSWWMVAGFAAFFPWMIHVGLGLIDNRRPVNGMGSLILLRTVLFYIGHPQFFLYFCLFELFTMMLLFKIYARESFFRVLFQYGLSMLLTIPLILPLLLPLWQQSEQSIRSAALNPAYFASQSLMFNQWTTSLLFPFIEHFPKNPVPYRHFQNICHIGYITLLLCVASITIVFDKDNRQQRRLLGIFGICFLIAFLWSTGLLNQIIYRIPVLNRFRWPFKVMLFSNFYLVIISCLGMAVMIARSTAKKPAVMVAICIVFHLVNMAVLFDGQNIKSFNFVPMSETVPAPEKLARQINDARIISVGSNIKDPYISKSLGFNFASLWGLYQIGGYDPLVGQANFDKSLGMYQFSLFNGKDLPVNYLRDWGIKYYIVLKNHYDQHLFKRFYVMYASEKLIPQNDYASILKDWGFTVVSQDDSRTVFADLRSKPMAYMEKSDNSTDWKILVNSMVVNVDSNVADGLIVNFLYNRNLKAILDSKASLTVNKTTLGNIRIPVPAGKHRIKLIYQNPWFKTGSYIFCISLLCYTSAYLIMRKRIFLRRP